MAATKDTKIVMDKDAIDKFVNEHESEWIKFVNRWEKSAEEALAKASLEQDHYARSVWYRAAAFRDWSAITSRYFLMHEPLIIAGLVPPGISCSELVNFMVPKALCPEYLLKHYGWSL